MASFQYYNVTYNATHPIFQYFPTRALSLEMGWYPISDTNVTTNYTGSEMQFVFTGTAAWLYGYANGESEIGMNTDRTTGTYYVAPPGPGLLYEYINLPYGTHYLNMTAFRAPVTVVSAVVTVGEGDPDTKLQNTTIPIVSDKNKTNPFFTLNGDWNMLTTPTNYMQTTDTGANVTFGINSSVAFTVYGSFGTGNRYFTVDLDPAPPFSDGYTSFVYDAFAPWDTVGEVLYTATGLNRTQHYNVTLSNDENSTLALEKIVAFDAPPQSSMSTSSSSSTSSSRGTSSSATAGSAASSTTGSATAASSSSHDLSSRAIVGIAIGVGLSLIAIVILVVFLIMRKRRRPNLAVEIDPIYTQEHYEEEGQHDYGYSSVADEVPSQPFTKSYIESRRSLPGVVRVPDGADMAGGSSSAMRGINGVPVASSNMLGSPSDLYDDLRSLGPPPTEFLDDMTSPAGIREQDAGRLPMTAPPEYDPAWNDEA